MSDQLFEKFSHVMVYVNDVARAVAWYCDTLGFSVEFNDEPHYAALRHNELKLSVHLHPDRKGTNVGHGAEIYFLVKDINEAAAKLRSKGLNVPEAKSEGGGAVWFTSFKDSEGNTLGIWQQSGGK